MSSKKDVAIRVRGLSKAYTTIIADEVLAVGDQEFQKKCLGKSRPRWFST